MIRAAGHIGLFAGLYVVGAMVCVWQLGGLASSEFVVPSWAALVAVGLIATGTYALDRVKLRDTWMDPADREAQPERYAFLSAHSATVRMLALVMLAAGGAIGWFVNVLAPAAAVLAAAGVVAYAPMPRLGRRRLKDRLGLKNAYVAAGITGFVAVAALADAAGREHPPDIARTFMSHGWAMIGVCLLVGVRTLVDAALCDLDDEGADRRHGTATLPTTLGGGAAWRITGVVRVFASVATLACVWCPWRTRVAWAIVGAIGILALRMRRPRRVRDLVDIRFAMEALAASVVLLAWRGGEG